MILPDPKDEADESPFEIYTLDPRNAFVVYHSGLGNKPMMGVKYVIKKTEALYFRFIPKISISRYHSPEYSVRTAVIIIKR